MDLGDVMKDLFGHPPKKNINPSPDVVNKPLYLSVFPAIGYTLQTRLAAIIAGNIAFYANPVNTNLSTITSSISYTENQQVTLPVQSNLWTKNNKFNFQGDWRFYKYPQQTYGLGSANSIDSGDLIKYSYLRFYSVLLRNIAKNIYVGGGYFLDYHWNIDEAGYPNGRISDYQRYAGTKEKSTSSGLGLDFLFDSRTNPVNSSGGAYANILYRDNPAAMGSTNSWQSLLIDLRKYFRFPQHSNNVIGFWSYNWLILSGKPPYLDLPSTSWDTYTNTGRGYIQGRFRSFNMLYLEAEYRFQISNNGLFGGVVFANTQAFSGWPSGGFSQLQPAVGTGLRVKLNKNSKTNLDIDYGFGTGESHGLFVNIGEVF